MVLISLVILAIVWPVTMYAETSALINICLAVITSLTMIISLIIAVIIHIVFSDGSVFSVFKSYFFPLFMGIVYFHFIYRLYTLFNFKEENISIVTASIFLAIPIIYMLVSFGYISFGLQKNINLMDNQVTKLSYGYKSYTTPEQYEKSLTEIYTKLVKFYDKNGVTFESSYGYVKMSHLIQFPMRIYNNMITDSSYSKLNKKVKIAELQKICTFIVELNSSGITDNLKQERNAVVVSLVEYALLSTLFFTIHTRLIKKYIKS